MKVVKIAKAISASDLNVADGEYPALWGGYEVTCSVLPGVTLYTDKGVRGWDIPVTVVVRDGQIEVRP